MPEKPADKPKVVDDSADALSSAYLALFVADYFKAKQQMEGAQKVRKRMLAVTKRVLKQLLALFSLLFPQLLQIRRTPPQRHES